MSSTFSLLLLFLQASLIVAQSSLCPNGRSPESTLTANGIRFGVCKNTDFQGGDIGSGVGNTRTLQALANGCAARSGCIGATLITGSREAWYKRTLSRAIAKSGCDSIFRLDQPQPPTTTTSPTTASTNQPVATSPVKLRGRWGPVIEFPVIPVAAYIIPEQPVSNKMLVYSASGNITFSNKGGVTQFAEWNHATKKVTHREISNTKHDMFCPGMSMLADGRLIISGGQNAEATSIFHPSTNSFTRGPDMKIPRGYQTSVTLSNGKVFAIGGSWSGARGGKVGEIYDPTTNQWSLLPGAEVLPIMTKDKEGPYRSDNHAWLFSWKDGSVFQAGPSQKMHWYNTAGQGTIYEVGTRDSISDAMCAVYVMYDTGKIFSAGGAPDYTDSTSIKRAHLMEIDAAYGRPKVEQVRDMQFARGFANAVVLPDGKILITGGQGFAKVFNDGQSVLTPELFDSVSKSFTVMADEAIPRNYHSVSILMADATVFSGGGGLCGLEPGFEFLCAGKGRPVDHPDGQFFEPPYLFDNAGNLATRPVIGGVQDRVRVGDTLNIDMQTEQGATKFSIIRIGSVTHSVNSDQRRISLQASGGSGGKYTAPLPNDAGILTPGFWYVFAMNSNGVPSVARTIQITF